MIGRTTNALLIVTLGVVAAGCGSSKGGGARATSTAGISSNTSGTTAGVTSFQVAVVTSGRGAGTIALDPPSASGFYPSGTAVRITALPDATSLFAGWGGDLAGQTANPISITVSARVSVVARFEPPAPGTPVAAFTTNPAKPAGIAPLAITFTDASSNNPTGWEWSFGDGQTGSGRTVSHTYTTPGRYTVSLSASNAAGPGLPSIRQDLVVVVDRDAGSPYWYVNDTYGQPLKMHSTAEEALAQQVLVLVNQERARAGLAALQADVDATKAAKAHCEDMSGRNYFDHVSPEGWQPADRFRMVGGRGSQFVGENIAMGQRTAADVMTAWMNSPGHRANILDTRYTHLGVGLDQDGFYWAQVFLRR